MRDCSSLSYGRRHCSNSIAGDRLGIYGQKWALGAANVPPTPHHVRDASPKKLKKKTNQVNKKLTLQQFAVGRDRGQQRQEHDGLEREHFRFPVEGRFEGKRRKRKVRGGEKKGGDEKKSIGRPRGKKKERRCRRRRQVPIELAPPCLCQLESLSICRGAEFEIQTRT